jgi:uncharacterized protein (DUF58 family)
MEKQENLFDPRNEISLSNLELKARLVVEGFITGLHKSPYHGFSVEFSEHRPYRPGDEIRHIDWQVYGRSNKFYVKQFEEETNLRATIVVDVSKSMSYNSDNNISKFNYSIFLASALAYLMNRQRDAVGLAIYNNELVEYMPSKSKTSYVGQILKKLENTIPSDLTGTSNALDSLAERIKRRGLIIIISDLLDDIDSISNALNHFRHNNHEVLIFHILDPRELDFKLKSSNFIDLETGEELITQPHQLQKAYKETVENFISEIKNICQRKQVDYNLISTDEPFDKALIKFLAKRNKL